VTDRVDVGPTAERDCVKRAEWRVGRGSPVKVTDFCFDVLDTIVEQ